MSKINDAITHYTSVLNDLNQSIEGYSHHINIRKMTIGSHIEMIKSLKDIKKDLSRKGTSTRRIQELLNKFVEDYNMHVGALCNLKQMLAAKREEAYFLEMILNGCKV